MKALQDIYAELDEALKDTMRDKQKMPFLPVLRGGALPEDDAGI